MQNSAAVNFGPMEWTIKDINVNVATTFVAVTTQWILKQGISRTDSICS